MRSIVLGLDEDKAAAAAPFEFFRRTISVPIAGLGFQPSPRIQSFLPPLLHAVLYIIILPWLGEILISLFEEPPNHISGEVSCYPTAIESTTCEARRLAEFIAS